MEFGRLQELVLMIIGVGMVLGAGVITFLSLATASATVESISNESVVWAGNETNPTNRTLAHGNLTSFTYFLNHSGDALPGSNYTIFLEEGIVQIEWNASDYVVNSNDTVFAYYSYTDYDTATEDTMNNMVSASEPIATTWIPLIVTIFALAVIIVLVVRSFGAR